jgi:TPR repeat protein
MSEQSQLEVRAKDGDSSLSISAARSGLIARGRRDAEVLTTQAESKEPRRSFELRVTFQDGRAREEWLKDGEKGDPKGQNLLACDYLFDYKHGSEKGREELAEAAAKWFRKAADQGLREAQFNLGLMYDVGTGVVRDYTEAAKWYRMAADQSVDEAQFSLGVMYDNGDGLVQDRAEAAKWYRKAADQGLDIAEFNLGVMYDNGDGVLQDCAEAAKWYRRAADRGLYKAEFNLGLKYINGQGVPQDYIQAYKWMNLATRDAGIDAEKRCAAIRDRVASKLNPPQIVEAQRLVGEYIDNWEDPDFQFDYTEAVRWWRKAADAGNAEAQNKLGEAYYNGYGVPQDNAEAAKWYGKAVEQGHASAQQSVGVMYRDGRGVPQDYVEAVNWYRKAAEQGNADAQNSLGDAYNRGNGVPQDFTEAVKWFRRAAEQGSAYAQHILGCMYANGEGVPKDYMQAHMWSNLAAEHYPAWATENRNGAIANRDLFARQMTIQQISEAQRLAREWEAERNSQPENEGHRA